MQRIVVFDVVESLLDLRGVDPLFEELFGDAGWRDVWFQRLLNLALTQTITGPYRPFGTLAQAALEMLAGQRGIVLSEDDRSRLKSGLARLPPHPDVSPGLQALQEAGFRLFTLSNTPREASVRQLEHAGIRPFFEDVFSADDAQRLKPGREAYQMVLSALNLPAQDLWFAAAHSWDIAGAQQVGFRTAFIARAGHLLNPLAPPPDASGPDLITVAAAIIAQT